MDVNRKIMKAWIEAMRLRTLPVSIGGVIAGVGIACYFNRFKLIPALICLLFAIFAQIASNFANEYYDYKNNFDRKGRAGFRRGVTEGDIRPESMRNATYALIIADSLLGCCLIPFGSLILIPIGILIALFAIAYSTGPYPLSHHGLGDIAVVIFFGLVPVMFTTYVQTANWGFWPVGLPVSLGIGLLSANILIVNNYRDMDDDKACGKKTTVVIFGRKAMGRVYFLNGLIGIVLIVLPLFNTSHPIAATSIAASYMVFHIYLFNKLRRNLGSALNPLLGKTAILLTAVSLTITILFIVL